MQKLKSKTMAIMIAIFLMLSMSASMMLVQTASAAGTMETYPFIGAVPNPTNVGQRTLIHFGITEGLGSVDKAIRV